MSDKLINVFSGSEVSVLLLKASLEESGITSIIKNEFRSGLMAGFGAGSYSTVELFIYADDLPKAKPIIDDFTDYSRSQE